MGQRKVWDSSALIVGRLRTLSWNALRNQSKLLGLASDDRYLAYKLYSSSINHIVACTPTTCF